MNENEPKDFSKLASYLGREQYGNAPTWPVVIKRMIILSTITFRKIRTAIMFMVNGFHRAELK